MKRIIISISLIFIILITGITGCTNALTVSSDSSYPAVVAWNYTVYGLSVETVLQDSVDKEIGEVKRNMNPMPEKNGDSNIASEGSKIYKLKNINQQDAIAVDIDGKLYKAYKNWPLQ